MKLDADRDHILTEIRRLAVGNGGTPPGQMLFARETGIAEHQWCGKLWPRWADALIDAGFEPNKWTERLDSAVVLESVAHACRHYGRMPTRYEFQLFRRAHPEMPSEKAIVRHFGRRADLITALALFASENPGYSDVAALLPSVAKIPASPQHSGVSKLGWVYLMRMGDYHKVGATGDLEERMRRLSSATPENLEYVHFMKTDDPFGIEAYWKKRFSAKQTKNEWFRLTVSDVAAFKKLRHF
jgi:hypothetical protein